MQDFVGLSHEDLERLLFLIDASVRINKRFQFFLWAQGTLQSFIPHETLVCAMGDLQSSQLRSEVFSRATLPDEFDAFTKDPIHGFVAPALAGWHARNRLPLVLNGTEQIDGGLHPMLHQLGYQHNLCHGVKDAIGGSGGFFLFLGVQRPVTKRELYFADLLMPHLYISAMRMFEEESGITGGPVAVLSEREVQVLGWVRDGKTNAEIAQILDISPLTVKNHVQKILRKLDVCNRAQAVAKAASIGLFMNARPVC